MHWTNIYIQGINIDAGESATVWLFEQEIFSVSNYLETASGREEGITAPTGVLMYVFMICIFYFFNFFYLVKADVRATRIETVFEMCSMDHFCWLCWNESIHWVLFISWCIPSVLEVLPGLLKRCLPPNLNPPFFFFIWCRQAVRTSLGLRDILSPVSCHVLDISGLDFELSISTETVKHRGSILAFSGGVRVALQPAGGSW